MSKTNFKIKKTDFENAKQYDVANLWHFFKFLSIRYLKSPVTYFTLLIPLIMTFGLSTVINVDVTYMATLSIGVIAHSFIAYGTSFFSLRKSTLNKNLRNSGVHRASTYAIVGLFAIITTFIFATIIMGIYFTFNAIPGLLSKDAMETAKPIGRLTGNHWGVLFNYVFTSSILAVAISYLFSAIAGDIKGFMAMSISYMIITVVFGAVISYDFADLGLVQNGKAVMAVDYFTERFLAEGVITQPEYQVIKDGVDVSARIEELTPYMEEQLRGILVDGKQVSWGGSWWVNIPSETYVKNGEHFFIGPAGERYAQMRANGEIFGQTGFDYWVSMFIPHYHANNLGQPALMAYNTNNQQVFDRITNTITKVKVDVKLSSVANTEYLMSYYMPWLFSIGSVIAGSAINLVKERRA